MQALKIEAISKRYGKIQALKEVSLTVHRGEIWGILGPNGSGKTTLLGVILDIIHADAGNFRWFEDLYHGNHRLHLGALLETPNFYPDLNALENLRIIQHIKKYHDDDLQKLLQLVKLDHRKYSKFTTYSLGMKQRLAIAGTLIGNPEVIIFDEPTNGLDPEGIADVRQTLREVATSGKTIILASHILDEVEKICSHAAILQNGALIKAGPVSSILSDKNLYQLQSSDNSALFNLFEQFPGISNIRFNHEYLELETNSDLSGTELNKIAFNHGIILGHLVNRKTSLEEEFLKLIQG